MVTVTADDIIRFWFAENQRQHWFNASTAFDRLLTDRYDTVLQAAANGDLEDWAQSATGTLALIIVLDQFSRNIHRGTAAAYSNDARACALCKQAIDRRFDESLEGWHKAFMYMPLMHSESLADQDLSVDRFTSAGLDNARYALHHRDIIRRFGRFPHRNRILGRTSSAEELAYLDSDEAFNG